jgi:hypothetical protein
MVITNAQSKLVRCPWPDCRALVHFTPIHEADRFPYVVRGRCDENHPILLTFLQFGLPPTARPDRSAGATPP